MERKDYLSKDKWYKLGEDYERKFVTEICPFLGLPIIINPAKETNKSAPDLFNIETQRVADLKVKTTPFYSAPKFKFDPQFTIIFSTYEYNYYLKAYPEIMLYFWVKYARQLEKKIIFMYGIWEAELSEIRIMVDFKLAPIFHFKHKHSSEQDSHVILLDLKQFKRLL